MKSQSSTIFGNGSSELVSQAKLLPYELRKQIILSIGELELQQHLADLFRAAEPSYQVEVTQGPRELGKDLVLIKSDTVGTRVVGIVVKCGNIAGKTLGEVDDLLDVLNNSFPLTKNREYREIRSQVLQARNNDAEVKDSLETYRVNQVIVIVNGEISNAARTRLNAEVSVQVDDIRGISWLVDKFTEFYPQVFFEGRVTTFIDTKLAELEARHTPIKSKKSLSDCFVEPVVQTADIGLNFEDGIKAFFNRKKIPFSRLKSVIGKKQHVLVIGDPGNGKSAALAKLTLDLFREAYSSALSSRKERPPTQIPILVSARDIAGFKDLAELLAHYFADSGISGRVSINGLFVDALDEVNANHREEVLEKATAFAQALDASLIITSRNIDLVKIAPIGFERYELMPFGAGQALNLIKKMGANKDVLSTLRESLEQIKHQIPMVPLSLLLLVEIVEEYKEVPASVTELYDRYIDSILGRHDKSKGIEVLFEYLIKKRFLAELAYDYFLSKNNVEIVGSDFKEFTEIFAEKYNYSEEDIVRFTTEVERAGVLQISDDLVAFRHRSFLDYFGAFYIYDRREDIDDLDDLISAIYFDEDYGETAFFYVGLLRKIGTRLLNRILDYDDDTLSGNLTKIEAGRLLQAGWGSESKIKSEGISRSLQFANVAMRQIKSIGTEAKWEQATVISNLMVMIDSEFSFRSGHLQKELLQLYREISDRSDVGEIFVQTTLLWVIRPYLTADDLRKEMEVLLDRIVNSSELRGEDSVGLTAVISILDQRQNVITKAIRKRIAKIYDKHPKELFKLLPPERRKPVLRPPV